MFSYCLAEKGASHSFPSHATPTMETGQQGYSSEKSSEKTPSGALCCRSSDIQRFCSLHLGTAGGGPRARACVTTPSLDMGDWSSSQLLSQSSVVSPCQDSVQLGSAESLAISRDWPLTTAQRHDGCFIIDASCESGPSAASSFRLNSHSDSKIL